MFRIGHQENCLDRVVQNAIHANHLKFIFEIRNLPRDIALDLDIFPGDAEKLARRAVWGK